MPEDAGRQDAEAAAADVRGAAEPPEARTGPSKVNKHEHNMFLKV